MADESKVAARAYVRWEREGRPHGRDREHWVQAERDLQETPEAETPSEHYGQGEMPERRTPDPTTGLESAQAQAGEGLPEPEDPPPPEAGQRPGAARAKRGVKSGGKSRL